MVRRVVLAIIVFAGIAILIVALVVPRINRKHLALNTCIDRAERLRVGEEVRLLGVQMGAVRSLRPQPDQINCPVRVELSLWIPKYLSIPRDAKTSVEADGVLGPAYVEIDTLGSTGGPIEDGGTLRVAPVQENGDVKKITEVLGKIADKIGVLGPVQLQSLEYPEVARLAQISGEVRVRAAISDDGQVSSVSADGPNLLKEAAVENCKRWRFFPYKAREVVITYQFQLDEPKMSNRPVSQVVFDLPDRVIIHSHAPLPDMYGVILNQGKSDH